MSSQLFSPVSLGRLSLPNRIVIPPMCQYSACDGQATDWHLMHYGAFSHSGAGLLIMEATAVTPEGRISPDDLGLWSDGCEAALGRVVAAIRGYSSIPLGLQLAHAGRKASRYAPWKGSGVAPQGQGGWLPEAPSPLTYQQGTNEDVTPRELSPEDCERLVAAFAEAARRAARIGFDALEVHGAHGYLLHEFLSPISNARTDKYGGSLEKRMAFPLAVFEAVRRAFPADRPVGMRISGSDWVPGGWNVEESCRLAVELQKRGSAYIHVSGGGLSPEQQLKPGPGYQADMAARIRRELATATGGQGAMPVIAVGLITEPEQAETLIVSGQADMVALGRAMLYNPRWPWHAAARLGATVTAPPQYWRSVPHGHKGLFGQ